MGQTISELVAQAQSRIDNLSPDDVAGERQALVVDIREPPELAASGVIPGAVNAPRGMLEFYADPSSPYHRPEFDPAKRTILVCGSGARSALGVISLQQLGYQDVAHLKGGMKAWMDNGFDTVHLDGATT